MNINIIQNQAKQHFPNLQFKYKDKSNFMKLLSYILFFNKSFMTSYTTTIGSTIYYPSEKFVSSRSISATTILLHELVHVYDSIRFSNILYSFLYLLPISLLPLALLLFLVSWKIALIVSILCLLPLPAYFRMYFERRAYMASLYVIKKMSEKLSFNPYLGKRRDSFVSEFKSSAYYFMWIFPSIGDQFDEALVKIEAGKRPYEDDVFDILDDLLDHIETT